MFPASPIHDFRPPAGPRTCIRPECRPVTAAFRHWLRSDAKTAAAAPAPPQTPQATTTGGSGNAPGTVAPELPAEYRAILSPSTGGRPAAGNTGHLTSGQQPPTVTWPLQVSPLEWVFLNKLGRKFPEAWEYMRREAMLYAGDNPDDYDAGPLPEIGPDAEVRP